MINVFQPDVGVVELGAVREVFESNWLGKGQKTDEFEAAWAKHIGVPPEHVVSISSCTEALFMSMQLLGIGPQDEVILPSISFVGAANAVKACGATPVFCDVDPRSLNATPWTVYGKIGKWTRAVLVQHYGGNPCDIREMKMMCKDQDLFLIEDSACAPGSLYDMQACGTYGDIGMWSFDAMKVITTGDGGMMFVRDRAMADKARRLAFLGLSSTSGLTSTDYRWWEFDVEMPARRSQMNDVQSAIGLVQLERMPAFLKHREHIREIYDARLGKIAAIKLPPYPKNRATSSNYMYWIQLDTKMRDELAHYLRDNGVYTTFRYYPLHLVSLYGSAIIPLPDAELAAAQTLNLPIHQRLTGAEVDMVCGLIEQFCERSHKKN